MNLKPGARVYLVYSRLAQHYDPILAVFAEERDAAAFAAGLDTASTFVVPRTLWRGPPPSSKGYNE